MMCTITKRDKVHAHVHVYSTKLFVILKLTVAENNQHNGNRGEKKSVSQQKEQWCWWHVLVAGDTISSKDSTAEARAYPASSALPM